MEANPLVRRGRALEDSFFREAEARRRRRAEEVADVESLARSLGIAPDAVPPVMLEAGLTVENSTAFELLPLIEVAWADGEVDGEERWRVLSHGVALGLVLGGPAHACIELWLRERPSEALFEAWHELAASRHRPPEDAPDAERLCEAAQAVASAACGVFGLRTVSSAEAAAIQRMEASLGRAA